MDHLENHIRNLASEFPYPNTPQIDTQIFTGERGSRLPGKRALAPAWAWIVGGIVFILVSLLAVPSVRAAIVEFIQIGAIRIFTEEENPPLPTPSAPLPVTPPLRPTPTPLNTFAMLQSLVGKVTLEEARNQAPFLILLPSYPSDLGEPDQVFYQTLEQGKGVLMVWLAEENPDVVEMSLMLLGPGAFAGKGAPTRIEETTVKGTRAVWAEGPHLLVLMTGPNQYDLIQFFVQGHVLAWEIDGVTYRLEGLFDMDEAIKIAESVE